MREERDGGGAGGALELKSEHRNQSKHCTVQGHLKVKNNVVLGCGCEKNVYVSIT